MIDWISVKDRLPIDYKSVSKYETVEILVVVDGIVDRCEFQCGPYPKPWYDFDNLYTHLVTHWQPFPEPPETKS